MADEIHEAEFEPVDDAEAPAPNPTTDIIPIPDMSSFVPQIRMKEEAVIELYESRKRIIEQTMVEGIDYGIIPGTGDKRTAFQPGVQKLQQIYGFGEVMELAESTETWADGDAAKAFFSYTYKVGIGPLDHEGTVRPIAWGEGNANSYEGKWRWRKGERVCPKCGKAAIIKGKSEYGGGWVCFKKKDGCGEKFPDGDQSIEGQNVDQVPNPDVYALVNTIQKMAQKRAHMAAVLKATGMSAFFTQDMDDRDVRRASGVSESGPPPDDDPWEGGASRSAAPVGAPQAGEGQARSLARPTAPPSAQTPTAAPQRTATSDLNAEVVEDERLRRESLRAAMLVIEMPGPQLVNHLKKITTWKGGPYRGQPLSGEYLLEAEHYVKVKADEKLAAESEASFAADGTPLTDEAKAVAKAAKKAPAPAASGTCPVCGGTGTTEDGIGVCGTCNGQVYDDPFPQEGE
jgi:ssDNA-binding Zn-finger/Zn-ribbon topoisomerase 1